MGCDKDFACPLIERVRRLEEAVEDTEAKKGPEFEGVGCSFTVIRRPYGWLINKTGSELFETQIKPDRQALHNFADWIKLNVSKP